MSADIQCPEIPFFGAPYPDARCIDGYLWDLDKCDNQGNLFVTSDNPPCPFCNREQFVDYAGGPDEKGKIDEAKIDVWIQKMKERYETNT